MAKYWTEHNQKRAARSKILFSLGRWEHRFRDHPARICFCEIHWTRGITKDSVCWLGWCFKCWCQRLVVKSVLNLTTKYITFHDSKFSLSTFQSKIYYKGDWKKKFFFFVTQQQLKILLSSQDLDNYSTVFRCARSNGQGPRQSGSQC